MAQAENRRRIWRWLEGAVLFVAVVSIIALAIISGAIEHKLPAKKPEPTTTIIINPPPAGPGAAGDAAPPSAHRFAI